jgi:hypothetical protein
MEKIGERNGLESWDMKGNGMAMTDLYIERNGLESG